MTNSEDLALFLRAVRTHNRKQCATDIFEYLKCHKPNFSSAKQLDAFLIWAVGTLFGSSTDADILFMAFGLLDGYHYNKFNIGNRRDMYLSKSDVMQTVLRVNEDYSSASDKRKKQLRNNNLRKAEDERITKLSDFLIEYMKAYSLESLMSDLRKIGIISLPKPSYISNKSELDTASSNNNDRQDTVADGPDGAATSIESEQPNDSITKNDDNSEISQFTIDETPLAFGWGDSGGGRPSHTLAQVKGGILGDTIVFNSISDSVIGNEKNFLGVREDDGKHTGLGNVWNSNRIAVEDGKTYIIRLYIHNNNPTGTYAIAKDVRAAISLPYIGGKQIRVTGFIESSNAKPNRCWANVVFYSNQAAFRLEYVFGSAILENNVFGEYTRISNYPNIKVSDDIVTRASSGGILVNYNTLDGSIPGGYQCACYISIRVRAVFDTK